MELMTLVNFDSEGYSIGSCLSDVEREGFYVAPDWFKVGMTAKLVDGEIVPSDHTDRPVPIDVIRAKMLSEVNARCEMMLGALKAGYPDGEVVSWDQQVIEARAREVSPTAVTPLLSAIAAQRGIDVTTLAGRVLEKANAYAVASGSIIGARQRLEDAINAANTVEALSAINTEWPT